MAVVLAIPGSEDQATKLGARLGVAVITPEIRRFPDGEIYVRIDCDLAGHDAVIVGSLYPAPAEKFLTTAFVASTARDLGARQVGLVAPYLAFMRQDVQFKPGEGVTSTYFARLVSSTVDWMVTVDPHLHRHHSLDGLYAIPTRIAHAAPEIARWVKSEVERPVLIGPDAESVQWVSAVAERCGAPFLILEKTRRGDRDVSISAPGVNPGAFTSGSAPGVNPGAFTSGSAPGVNPGAFTSGSAPGVNPGAFTSGSAPGVNPGAFTSGSAPDAAWRGHTPVVIDDIVSTGKTMIEATRQLRAAGSEPPVCVAIHAVFADSVLDELTAAGAAGIITCNTIPHLSNRICVADPIAEAAKAYLAS